MCYLWATMIHQMFALPSLSIRVRKMIIIRIQRLTCIHFINSYDSVYDLRCKYSLKQGAAFKGTLGRRKIVTYRFTDTININI